MKVPKTTAKKITKKVAELLEEFHSQSKTHADKSLQYFYSALLNTHKDNKELRDLINHIFYKRPDLTIKHMTNLMYRALQYIYIYNKSQIELENYTKEDWTREIKKLLNSKTDKEEYKILMEHENTQTTVYQRYIGPKATISVLYSEKNPINILDIGCGLNLGLPGIELNYPFKQIEDTTSKKLLSKHIDTKIKIGKGYSIDIENPVEKQKWALACGFYPSELANLPDVESMCEFLWEKTKTKFIKLNVMELSKTWKEKKLPGIDVAIASTVLYQFTEKERKKALIEIKKVLRKNGILIINDFVEVNPKLTWNVDWFENSKPTYKTVILKKVGNSYSKPYEFINWNNGRCKTAYEGKDFYEIINTS